VTSLPTEASEVREYCKQQLQKRRKEQLVKKLHLTDQLSLRNPQHAAEFAQEIFETMRERETMYMVSPTYLEK
jgi:hypothetical protein